MVPGEQVVGLDLELSSKEGEVTQMLSGLVSLVAEVLQHQVGGADGAAVGLSHSLDGGRDLLVDDPVKTDPGVVAPQPELPVRGGAHPGSEQQTEGDLVRADEQLLDGGA